MFHCISCAKSAFLVPKAMTKECFAKTFFPFLFCFITNFFWLINTLLFNQTSMVNQHKFISKLIKPIIYVRFYNILYNNLITAQISNVWHNEYYKQFDPNIWKHPTLFYVFKKQQICMYKKIVPLKWLFAFLPVCLVYVYTSVYI